MYRGRLKLFLGSMLAVAVFAFALITAPPEALAKNNGKKMAPGQMKKMQRISFSMMGDIQGHWAAEPVTAMQKIGIIKGYSDGKFYPQKQVSRSEALVMVMRSLGFEGQEPSKSSLEKVKDCPEWARETVALALDKGIITREEIKDFDGNGSAQRYEIAVWIARAVQDGELSEYQLSFTDSDLIPAYAKNYVSYMARNGIMKGYPGNSFKPLQPVLRAEIATMLFRCQDKFSTNANFNYLKGDVEDVLPGDPAYIIIKTENGTEVMVHVADDAAIFVDGEASDLNDIEQDYTVTVVLNPARKATVVSANSGDKDEDEDDEAPEVKELDPEDGADNVEIGLKTLTVTFDENIYPVDDEEDIEDNIIVENVTEDEEIKVRDIDIDGKELIIKLEEGLMEDSDYSVRIPDDILEDADGNEFEGIDEGDWEFTTSEDEDDVAPEIKELDPEDGADNVEIGLKTLTVTFDENIYPVDDEEDIEDNIVVENVTEDEEIKVRDIDIDGKELIIKLEEGLMEDSDYSVRIPDDILEDADGNEFEGIDGGDWEFTTVEDEDDNAPKVEELIPGDGDTEYGEVDELIVKFNEEVRWVDEDSDDNKVIIYNLDNNSLITPDDVNLEDDELVIEFDDSLEDGEYSITIQAGIIEDLSDNEYNGIGVNDWVFEVK